MRPHLSKQSFFSQNTTLSNSQNNIQFEEQLSFGYTLAPNSGDTSLQLSISGDENEVRKVIREILFGDFQKDGVAGIWKQETSIPEPHLQINLRLTHGSLLIPIFHYLMQEHHQDPDFSNRILEGNKISYYDYVKERSVWMCSPFADAQLSLEKAKKLVKNGRKLTIQPHDYKRVCYLCDGREELLDALLFDDEKLEWNNHWSIHK